MSKNAAVLCRLVPLVQGLLLVSACSSAPRPVPAPELVDEGAALITNTIDVVVPPDLEPAHIYKIDGESVTHYQGTFALDPGEHSIRVWPLGPAQRMVPDLEAIERESIQVDAINLQAEAGYRYYIAARRKQTRTVVEVLTEEGVERRLGDWQVTIEPVVVRINGPLSLHQKVEGATGFFGSLLLGPLLGLGVP